ncbi:MAG TPA: hypothetical protein VIV61_12905 [Candidatus Ozemobacteraceae bacterium]
MDPLYLFYAECSSALLVSAVFLAIFGVAELLRGFDLAPQEITRKTVHLGAGLVSLSFAYVFKSHWTLLAMLTGFISMIILGKRWHLMTAVHGVARQSAGDLLHPLAIYITYLFAMKFDKPHFYAIAIAVLSVSDSLAAIIGKSYGFKLYEVEEDKKSVEGSIIFFLSTFLIVHLCLLLLTDIDRTGSVLSALLIALLATAFEAVSLDGADNLIVPVGTLFVLVKITRQSVPEMAFQNCLAGIIFFTTYLIARPSGKLGSSGLIGIALTGYAAWSLVTWDWYIPVLLTTILLSWVDVFLERPDRHGELHRIRPVFYTFIASFLWVLAANMEAGTGADHMYIIPYMVSIAGNLCIRWGWYCRTHPDGGGTWLPPWFVGIWPIARATLLAGIFLPFHLLGGFGLAPGLSVATFILGTWLSDRVYWLIGGARHGTWDRKTFLRMGMAVVVGASAAVYAVNLWYY